PFSMRSLASQLDKMFQPIARNQNVEFFVDLHESVAHSFLGDHLRLRQVLVNLIGNAIKFCPHGGGVVLHISHAQDLKVDDQNLCFAVIDSGIGIPKERQKLIFNAFQQADSNTTRNFGGTGLGLSISSQLVDMMGGQLFLRSNPGIGSVFYFSLALEECENVLERVKPLPIVSVASSPLRVLVAEDNYINQKLITAILERAGHVVTIARDGEELIDLLEEGIETDLICMDIQMPKMNGVQAAKQIRAMDRVKSIPIIAVTAHALDGDEERYMALGIDGYVCKPIHRESFLSLVSSLGTKPS
ncbi:MAG: response regulator, partial [Bdellovibrionales bacterium]|nr:response regulator [Bdellovibrionales bacterium]